MPFRRRCRGLRLQPRDHVIADLPTKNVDRRITLKLHYVVYPKCFGPIGKVLGTLATWYNTTARNLFLAH